MNTGGAYHASMSRQLNEVQGSRSQVSFNENPGSAQPSVSVPL